MADQLFETIEELKEYLAVDIGSHEETILPYVRAAQVKYIKPLLGSDQLALLLETSLTSASQDLLPYARRPLAFLTYALALPQLNVSISDIGVHVHHTDDSKPALAWQFDRVEESFLKMGYEALDEMLEFLEENKDDYPEWADSDAYTVSKKFFINSASEFSEYYNIRNSRRTYLAIQAVMKKVEDFDIEGEICSEYFDSLKASILDGTISADDTKVLSMLRPAIANLTIARALGELSVEVTDQGIMINSYAAQGENNRVKNPAAKNQVLALRQEAENTGNGYIAKLKKYLNENASGTKYALYFASTAYTAPEEYPSTSTFQNTKTRKTFLT